MAPASAAVPSIRESLQAFNGMHSAADVPATLGAWQDSVKRWYQEVFSGGSVHAERDQIRPAARRPNTSDMVSMPASPQVSRRELPARGGSQRRAASCNGPRAKGEPPDSRRAPSPKAGPDPRSTMRMRSAGMGMSPSMSKRDITPSTSAGASAQGRSFPDDLPSTEASMPSATRANGSYAVDMEAPREGNGSVHSGRPRMGLALGGRAAGDGGGEAVAPAPAECRRKAAEARQCCVQELLPWSATSVSTPQMFQHVAA
ncbi:unnamed protein product, partial [Prorocentrum cordatum]